MTNRQTPAGATPVVESATLSQSYPFGPWFAQYRVPRAGTSGLVDPRMIGITFEGENSDSAGSAGGASGGQSDSGSAGSTGSGDSGAGDGGDSSTDDAALGAGGIKALEKERNARKAAEDRAKASEKRLQELEGASKSDHDKAIEAAKAEGKTEARADLERIVRNQAVREALLGAGVAPGLVKDLSKADEFAALKVTDSNEVDDEELEAAVKLHKKRVPDAYRKAGDNGSADGGSRGGNTPAKSLDDAIGAHYQG